jgi:hypothetical protein
MVRISDPSQSPVEEPLSFLNEEIENNDKAIAQDQGSITDSSDALSTCETTPQPGNEFTNLSANPVQRLVEAIVRSDYFNATLDTFLVRVEILTYQNGNENDSASKPSSVDLSGAKSALNPKWGRQGSRKRPAPGNDEEDEDIDDRDGDPGDPEDPEGPTYKTLSRRLACPYFKHNPGRFRSSRSCGGYGWETTHRLKYRHVQ